MNNQDDKAIVFLFLLIWVVTLLAAGGFWLMNKRIGQMEKDLHDAFKTQRGINRSQENWNNTQENVNEGMDTTDKYLLEKVIKLP